MNTTHRLALESLCRVSRLHMTVITIALKNDFDLNQMKLDRPCPSLDREHTTSEDGE